MHAYRYHRRYITRRRRARVYIVGTTRRVVPYIVVYCRRSSVHAPTVALSSVVPRIVARTQVIPQPPHRDGVVGVWTQRVGSRFGTT